MRFVEPIVFVPDSSGPEYRPARLVGPARVLLRYPARATQRGRRLLVSQGSGGPMRRGKELAFAGRQRGALPMSRAVLLNNAAGRTIAVLLVAPNGRRYFLKRPPAGVAAHSAGSLLEARP